MDALVYFTRKKVGLEDIKASAQTEGYECEIVPWSEGRQSLNIEFGGFIWTLCGSSEELVKDHWVCDEDDTSSWEDEERQIVFAYKPVSIFVFTFRRRDLQILLLFLKRVMSNHGGWITGETERVYTEQDAAELLGEYPF